MLVAAAEPPLRLIHQQSTPGFTPAAADPQQVMQFSQVVVLGWGVLDQLIGILITEAIEGLNPGAMQALLSNGARLREAHTHAPAGAAAALVQAEHPFRQTDREHRHVALGQVEAAGPALRLLVEGRPCRHQAARVGHVNPDPTAAIGAPLQGQGIVHITGVRVIDGDAALVTEIQPPWITGMGSVSTLHQCRCFGFQVRRESGRPGGALQTAQLMALPLPQISQQTAHIAELGQALTIEQQVPQFGREAIAGLSGELQQALELAAGLGRKLVHRQGLPLSQPLAPLQLMALAQHLAMALPPQVAQILQAAGLDAALFAAEQILVLQQ